MVLILLIDRREMLGTPPALLNGMCKNNQCPIFGDCDKELDQSFYCRKIELLLHLSKLTKTKPRPSFIQVNLPKLVH